MSELIDEKFFNKIFPLLTELTKTLDSMNERLGGSRDWFRNDPNLELEPEIKAIERERALPTMDH
jgi:hypothetical protein